MHCKCSLLRTQWRRQKVALRFYFVRSEMGRRNVAALVGGQEGKLIRVCCVNGYTIFSSLLQGRERRLVVGRTLKQACQSRTHKPAALLHTCNDINNNNNNNNNNI